MTGMITRVTPISGNLHLLVDGYECVFLDMNENM